MRKLTFAKLLTTRCKGALLGLSIVLCGFATLYMPVHAQVSDKFFQACQNVPNSEYCKQVKTEQTQDRVLGKNSILVTVLSILIKITIVISVIIIIIGGFKYVISGGDSSGIQSAKNTILYAIVGILVATFANIIVNYVVNHL